MRKVINEALYKILSRNVYYVLRHTKILNINDESSRVTGYIHRGDKNQYLLDTHDWHSSKDHPRAVRFQDKNTAINVLRRYVNKYPTHKPSDTSIWIILHINKDDHCTINREQILDL